MLSRVCHAFGSAFQAASHTCAYSPRAWRPGSQAAADSARATVNGLATMRWHRRVTGKARNTGDAARLCPLPLGSTWPKPMQRACPSDICRIAMSVQSESVSLITVRRRNVERDRTRNQMGIGGSDRAPVRLDVVQSVPRSRNPSWHCRVPDCDGSRILSCRSLEVTPLSDDARPCCP